MSTSINLFHGDLYRVTFSNVPKVVNVDDLTLFENYVRSVTLPEYALEIDKSEFMGYQIQHPVAHKANNEMGLLQIEFKLCQSLKNYMYLFRWMQSLRYGASDTSDDVVPGVEPPARLDYVKMLTLSMLDNLKRTTGQFKFKHCFCVALSSLGLVTGTGEEITFTANFSYESITYEEADPQPSCTS